MRPLPLSASSPGPPGCQPPAPRAFEIQPVWFGQDDDQQELESFFDCLVEGSTFADYFEGEARLSVAASRVVAAPAAPFGVDGAGAFVAERIAERALPAPTAGKTPVYVFAGGGPWLQIDACGQFAVHTIGGQDVGVALVRSAPPCWPGRPMRSVTQAASHEIAEVIDALLGYEGCAGDGACQADFGCPAPCSNIVGLTCPGAPSGTLTGCDATPVDGWIVQKLGHEGRRSDGCHRCIACDFTPHALAQGEPREVFCAAPSASVAVVEPRGGCTQPGAGVEFFALRALCLLLLGALLAARRASGRGRGS